MPGVTFLSGVAMKVPLRRARDTTTSPVQNMGVDHGGAYILVAEKLLDCKELIKIWLSHLTMGKHQAEEDDDDPYEEVYSSQHDHRPPQPLGSSAARHRI